MKAYIFDMDGVLCDSEAILAEAACRVFQEHHGVQPSPADFLPFVGAGPDRYLQGVAEQHRVEAVLPRDKEAMYRLYAELVPGRLQPLNGVIEFVRAAHAQGIRVAVATSADPFKVKLNLEEIDLDAKLLSTMVTGADVTRKKPDPAIFLEAAARMDVTPTDCLVFEDAVNGVQAAKAAGMRCIGITSLFDADTLRAAGADETWPDFSGATPAV